MERGSSRFRSAGLTASGTASPGTPEQRYDERNSPARRSVNAADFSREQVQSALDGLLSDQEDAPSTKPSHGYGQPAESARSPGLAGRRRSYVPPEPIEIKASNHLRDQSSSGLLSPESQLNPGGVNGARRATAAISPAGYTPTAGPGRR